MPDAFVRALRALAIGGVAMVSPLATARAASIVSGPSGAVVDAGKTTVEFRAGAFEDNGSHTLRLRQQIDHAFNDMLALRLTRIQEDGANGGLHPQSTAVDVRLQLFERDRYGFDGGVRVNYTFDVADGKPEIADIRFLAEGVTKSDWRWRGNVILKQQVGAGRKADNPTLELRGSLAREAPSPLEFASLRLGVEVFAELGELRDFKSFERQDDQIGLTARFTTKDDVYLQFNVRAGLSEAAPDHGVSVYLAKSF